MLYKSYPVIAEISLNCLKIMIPVTSHLFFPGLISEMPPGSTKNLVMQLYGQPDRSASLCLYILHFYFFFKFWARVVGSVACKRVLWDKTVIFITNK